LSIARLQSGGGEAMLFSALKKQGLDEVAQLLWQWAHAPVQRVKSELVETNTDQEPEPESLD
jgi:GTP-binding protein